VQQVVKYYYQHTLGLHDCTQALCWTDGQHYRLMECQISFNWYQMAVKNRPWIWV